MPNQQNLKQSEPSSIPDDFDYKQVEEWANTIREFSTPVAAPHFHDCDDSPDCDDKSCKEFQESFYYYEVAFNHILETEHDIDPLLLSQHAEQIRYACCETYANKQILAQKAQNYSSTPNNPEEGKQ